MTALFKRMSLFFLIASQSLAALISAQDFGYPYEEAYYSTLTSQFTSVAGGETSYKTYQLNLFPQRKSVIPSYYKNNYKLNFGFYKQKVRQAPLIFIIAGTGGYYNSGTNMQLADFFYSQGFHVVTLSSPFSLNFIFGGSRSATPGITLHDAQDLHQVMKSAISLLKDKENINPRFFNLTGVSLGALESAFISKLDQQEKFFNFNKVILINPPLRLDVSAEQIDQLFPYLMKLGPQRQKVLEQKAYFTIFHFQQNPPPKDFLIKKTPLPYSFNQTEIKALIAKSFRDTLAQAIHGKELISPTGVINPYKNHYSSEPGLAEGFRLSFMDYFQLVAIPHWNQHYRVNHSFEEIVKQNSLIGISNYLKSSSHIYLIHNQDDIIMGANEMNELEEIFGKRAAIFPRGGHCGNLWFPQVYQHILEFLK